MAKVSITINQRDYDVNCEPGEEERISRLGGYIDERAGELVKQLGNVGDLRLLMLTNLTIADKLFDANAEVEKLRAAVAQAERTAERANEAADAGDDATLAPLVEDIAQRIEDIAAHLESA